MLSIKCVLLNFDLNLRLNLHSTMLSIKWVKLSIGIVLFIIYIPLCYLLNVGLVYNYLFCKLIYIPLCYLLNNGFGDFFISIIDIYIPLCYLLNTITSNMNVLLPVFTFHYVIY